MLDLTDGKAAVGNLYAITLVADDRETAGKKFREWMTQAKQSDAKLQVPLDGLLILSGDPAPARKLRVELLADAQNDPSEPELVSELGWWWYIARDYPVAADVLREAMQRRPGNVRIRARLTWAEIEMHRLADALQIIQNSYEDNTERTDRTMASTVARWQAQERDEALREFQTAIERQPQWKNPRWVGALYSPLVVQSIADMQAELDRRKKLAGR
jgi:tetratricopeptide (TPR) repeat protein